MWEAASSSCIARKLRLHYSIYREQSVAIPIHVEDIIGTDEAAAILGKLRRTLENWRQEQKGPPFVIRFNRCMYSRADVEAFAEKLKELQVIK